MIEMDMPKLEVLENDDSYAKIVCEPLEKGFGLTIGNCLRRILLSALPGAAVEGIKFLDGSVKHEFSAVAGVKEDVTEIILNLKTLAIKTKVVDKDYEKVLHIYKEGPAELKGEDLNVDAEIEVINKDQYICTIDEGGKFDVELTVGRGRGYRPPRKTNNRSSIISQSILSIRPFRRSTTRWNLRASGRLSIMTSSRWKYGRTERFPARKLFPLRRKSCRITSICSSIFPTRSKAWISLSRRRTTNSSRFSKWRSRRWIFPSARTTA